MTILDRIFLDEDDQAFVLAQWKVIAQSFSVTEKANGRKLCNALRKLAVSAGGAVKTQIIDLEAELAETERKIEKTEREMNSLLNRPYDLTDDEKQIVQQSA